MQLSKVQSKICRRSNWILRKQWKNWVQSSCAQASAHPPLKRSSLRNTNSKPSIKNTHEKLRSSSPSNRFCKQGISPSRKQSQTNEVKNEKYEKEVTYFN